MEIRYRHCQQNVNGEEEKKEKWIDKSDINVGFMETRNGKPVQHVLFRVSMRFIICYCCGLALFGLAACICLAVFLHFDASTKTHCNVANYLPTISAAFGGHTPEKYIWHICICLHMLPRFFIALAYTNFYLSSPFRPMAASKKHEVSYWTLCWLCGGLHVIENLSLMTLTYVSSVENWPVHGVSFALFMGSSTSYMLVTLYIFNISGRRKASTRGELSFQCKFFLCGAYLLLFLCCGYFFLRHVSYCEPGVFSLFALCEYLVVLTNIAFHATIHFDMDDKVFQLTTVSS